MRTIRVAGKTTFRAAPSLLSREGNDLPAVTTPTGTESRNGFKAMWNAMIDLVAVLVLQI